ncbi:hypothetical protein FNV43_RR13989 [Rhamnella rubrinervis]|uniref:Bifunctional inhibitor/plant lipid transfer protein/seed storage helical domain-containing protein n=1 Tax=Rhamnella rubrinervis TaxID=2594499 RepID=A0A8K0H274_9ROSA|nr:hypothetical protein FNV43_RR13989 [Rhamnella rubrinervis]
MRSQSVLAICAVVTAAALLLSNTRMAEAVTCEPRDLILSCQQVVQSPLSPPSPSGPCCVKLREQKTCFCGYLEKYSAIVKPYLNDPRVTKVASICGVTIPVNC